LLFARDPEVLVDLLRKHGIVVRNKHDDIPFAVRVSLPRIDILNQILDILEDTQKKAYSIQQIRMAKTILVDLDGTLRENSHWCCSSDDSRIWLQKQKASGRDVYIITNNTSHSTTDIAVAYGLERERVVNPLTFGLRKALGDIEANLHVVGNAQTQDYIRSLGFSIMKDARVDAVVIANSIFLSLEEWIGIATVFKENPTCKVVYTEDAETVTLEDCSDVPDEMVQVRKGLLIPDIQTGLLDVLIKTYGISAENVIQIGKPHDLIVSGISGIAGNDVVVIGNSITTDIGLAHRIGAYGVLVDASRSLRRGYDVVHDMYVIHDLREII
jgi:ribonucleotide monophosphatase NagD (HAD superfamily)